MTAEDHLPYSVYVVSRDDDALLEWCKANCRADYEPFELSVIIRGGARPLTFSFADERDAIAFRLTWDQ